MDVWPSSPPPAPTAVVASVPAAAASTPSQVVVKPALHFAFAVWGFLRTIQVDDQPARVGTAWYLVHAIVRGNLICSMCLWWGVASNELGLSLGPAEHAARCQILLRALLLYSSIDERDPHH